MFFDIFGPKIKNLQNMVQVMKESKGAVPQTAKKSSKLGGSSEGGGAFHPKLYCGNAALPPTIPKRCNVHLYLKITLIKWAQPKK